jgi:4-alpha-glucanotransferase
VPIIAEDLGVITDKVKALLASTGFPGMKVMIFGFTPNEDNPHLPHNYVQNSICYTSTHDSQSICEQIMDICSDWEASFAKAYIRWPGDGPMAWDAIRTLWSSPAGIAMTTMQDLLNLGADARMNVPSTLGGNWSWRVRREGINADVAGFLRDTTVTYKRYHEPPQD